MRLREIAQTVIDPIERGGIAALRRKDRARAEAIHGLHIKLHQAADRLVGNGSRIHAIGRHHRRARPRAAIDRPPDRTGTHALRILRANENRDWLVRERHHGLMLKLRERRANVGCVTRIDRTRRAVQLGDGQRRRARDAVEVEPRIQ